ncbi:hypothetical protein niasHT_002749 [Heterodera trifolii]|uniref:Uncharacterized protein n=1 Tax=Heterodera trifolii TaxID=157864 RepID=A0ABD2MA14_9BILA
MVFAQCSLFPSIFAILLLLCVISALLEHGHALECKGGIETETFNATDQAIEAMHKKICPTATHCVAAFCSSAETGFYYNTWLCSRFGPDSKAECEKEGHDNANKIRAGLETQFKMPAPAANDWKCTCHYGAKGKDMDNEQFVAPAPPVVKKMPKALKCKYSMELETLKFFDNAIEEALNKEVCANATHYGFYINVWGCDTLDAKDTEAKCEKEYPEAVNLIRASWGTPTATDWKCKCHFGAKGKDMDNEQFVAPAPPEGKSTSSRHGVGMPLMAIGLIIGFLPLFRGAILGRLNDVIEVNQF